MTTNLLEMAGLSNCASEAVDSSRTATILPYDHMARGMGILNPRVFSQGPLFPSDQKHPSRWANKSIQAVMRIGYHLSIDMADRDQRFLVDRFE